MKRKGCGKWRVASGETIQEGTPYPRHFDKRGYKLLKIKAGSGKKRGKRVQEAASA
jgi:hypothetical protein